MHWMHEKHDMTINWRLLDKAVASVKKICHFTQTNQSHLLSSFFIGRVPAIVLRPFWFGLGRKSSSSELWLSARYI